MDRRHAIWAIVTSSALTVEWDAEAAQRHAVRIAIKNTGRIFLIDPNDVVIVQAQGNYVSLQRRSDSYLLRKSISVMAEKWNPMGSFVFTDRC
jgi:DNA-binding LytR/AlgR family response regulator